MLRRAAGESTSSVAGSSGNAGNGSGSSSSGKYGRAEGAGAHHYYHNAVVRPRREGRVQIKLGIKKRWDQLRAEWGGDRGLNKPGQRSGGGAAGGRLKRLPRHTGRIGGMKTR